MALASVTPPALVATQVYFPLSLGCGNLTLMVLYASNSYLLLGCFSGSSIVIPWNEAVQVVLVVVNALKE